MTQSSTDICRKFIEPNINSETGNKVKDIDKCDSSVDTVKNMIPQRVMHKQKPITMKSSMIKSKEKYQVQKEEYEKIDIPGGHIKTKYKNIRFPGGYKEIEHKKIYQKLETSDGYEEIEQYGKYTFIHYDS